MEAALYGMGNCLVVPFNYLHHSCASRLVRHRLLFKVAFMKLDSVFTHMPKSWDYVGAQSNGLCGLIASLSLFSYFS